MPDNRSDNEKAFATFRKRLTEGFYIVDPETGDKLDQYHDVTETALRATKPWRNELWKALAQLERDVCPYTAMKQDKERSTK